MPIPLETSFVLPNDEWKSIARSHEIFLNDYTNDGTLDRSGASYMISV